VLLLVENLTIKFCLEMIHFLTVNVRVTNYFHSSIIISRPY